MLEELRLMDVAECEYVSGEDEVEESDSDSECGIDKYFASTSARSRLFGRRKPVHVVLGAGLAADIMLWRDKNISASILAGITIIWFIFEGLGYHLLTFISHSLLLLLALLFLRIILGPAAKLRPLEVSDITLPDKLLANAALSLRYDIIQGCRVIGAIVIQRDLKNFLLVSVTLWGLSVVAAKLSFLTFFYIVSVILLIVPMIYEKHEDIIDIIAEKVLIELNNQYAEVMKALREMQEAIEANTLASQSIDRY